MLVKACPSEDGRGALSRLFSKREFEEHGLECTFTQESVVVSGRAGTLRGFHFQAPPSEEAKLVTCVRGAMFDVILDIRRTSPSFGAWCCVTLHEGQWGGIYIPSGCAHAVQTLVDGTEVLYRMTRDYDASAAQGYRWSSPSLRIEWPFANPILSERDRLLPVFDPQEVIAT